MYNCNGCVHFSEQQEVCKIGISRASLGNFCAKYIHSHRAPWPFPDKEIVHGCLIEWRWGNSWYVVHPNGGRSRCYRRHKDAVKAAAHYYDIAIGVNNG